MLFKRAKFALQLVSRKTAGAKFALQLVSRKTAGAKFALQLVSRKTAGDNFYIATNLPLACNEGEVFNEFVFTVYEIVLKFLILSELHTECKSAQAEYDSSPSIIAPH